MKRTVVLELDELDFDAVQRAIAYYQVRKNTLPDYDGNLAGACIAETCRGYLDMLGKWPTKGQVKP